MSVDGVVFDVPAAAFAPSTRDERHLQWGTTLRTTRDTGWNASAVYSEYQIREDSTLQANSHDPNLAGQMPGTNSERDGTGWQTFEVQGVYTPIEGDWTGGVHTLAVGYHRNDYRLESPIYSTADWRSRAGVLSQNARGETNLQALYLQDAWALAQRWVLTLGVRYEDWEASNGFQFATGLEPKDYPSRTERRWSPKASLSFRPDDAWQVRLSAGRGVRFPTVAELFLGAVTSTQIVVNDPNLKPEISDSVDLSVEYQPGVRRCAVSLFRMTCRTRSGIRPTRSCSAAPASCRTSIACAPRGIETAFGIDGIVIDTLSLEGSIAYAEARILENANHPDYVGHWWPRGPNWRGNCKQYGGRRRRGSRASASVTQGKTYGRLENDDFNGDTFRHLARARVGWSRRVHAGQPSSPSASTTSPTIAPLSRIRIRSRTAFAEVRWSLEVGDECRGDRISP